MLAPATALLQVALQAQLIAAPPRTPLPAPSPGVARAVVHQNRVAAGRLAGGALTLAIDIVESAWRPEGDTETEVPILAFAEPGKAPSVPGPLVRAPRGTAVALTLRNRTDSALVVGGLRPGAGFATDTVQLAAGAVRTVRYALGTEGTYWYWAAFAGTTAPDRLWKDSQLNGAIVVDGPGPRMREEILLLSEWFLDYPDGRPFESVSVINGKGWPHTDVLQFQQDDSVRFRVINTIPLYHPMHLHGFFYRIESRGDGTTDRPVPTAAQPLSNTDLMAPGETFTLVFHASTPGNWLFHCHFAFHTDATTSIAGAPADTAMAHAAHAGGGRAASEEHMRGLVVGLKVAARPGYVEASTDGARTMHLFVNRDPLRLPAGAAAIGFALQEGAEPPAADSVVLPGPVLELRRGEPVRIVVRNNLREPTSVHWHGLEIESFPDGVPHWSGLGDRLYSQIAPGDTFVAAFTPPRAGTYPYHAHLDDRHKIASGMYGALLVTDAPRDTTRDHLIVAGGGGPWIEPKIESPYALVNGSRDPAPLRLAVGETHRLRVIAIHPDWRVVFTLRNDSTVARWTPIAKDGADLPAGLRVERAATVTMGPGQTEDFAFTPSVPGEWVLEVRSAEAGWQIPLPVIVEARAARP